MLRILGLAAFATLALAGTSAAHFGSAMPAAPPDAGWQRSGSGDVSSRRDSGRLPRLANSGDNPFFSFLESLLGLGDPGERRRARRPDRRPPAMPQRPSLPPPVIAPPAPEAVPAMPPPEPVVTYRTMCVRMCDGYYWPISFATTKDYLERDQAACASSCSSTAALYYYPNPGGAVEDMTNLDGIPYKNLGTAFLYRTIYDANCKCSPHPWETESLARHQSYPSKAGGVRAAAQSPRRPP